MMRTDSLKRCFCRITVFGSLTYRCSAFTGCSTILHPACRQFSRISFSQKTEARLKSIDKVPIEYALIYRAPMTSLMKVAQVMSCVSILSLGAVGAYKYITDTTFNFSSVFKMNEFNKLGGIEIDGELFLWISMFIIFNVGMCAVTMKYPLRIYHHEAANSYICVLNRFVPPKTKNISFNAGDIRRHIPFMSSVIPWRDALFKVGNRKMYIMENNFRTPADFTTMFCKV